MWRLSQWSSLLFAGGGELVEVERERDEAVLADEIDTSPKARGFGERDVSDDLDDEDVECQAGTGSVHSAASENRHDLDYLANKNGNLV